MKCAIRRAALVVLLLTSRGLADDVPSTLPTLADDEKAAGWKLLFDGVSTTGWRGLGMDGFPVNWIVQDGCLKCLGGYKNAPDLVTVDKYDNFELSFEWRFPKSKGNSGVKYRVQEQPGKGYAFGCEYQCWNDPEASDDHSSGALYDVFAPQAQKMAPKGEFNRSRIVVNGNHLEHWLNETKVVAAEFGSEAMQAALAKSYFKKSDWGKEPLGHIALQNHHSEIFFRNLKIRVLPAEASK
jgi:hypothetical protein